jgi:hypothetical protein
VAETQATVVEVVLLLDVIILSSLGRGGGGGGFGGGSSGGGFGGGGFGGGFEVEDLWRRIWWKLVKYLNTNHYTSKSEY